MDREKRGVFREACVPTWGGEQQASIHVGVLTKAGFAGLIQKYADAHAVLNLFL
jgi:hypothetical protein